MSSFDIKLLQKAYLNALSSENADDKYNALANLGQRYGEKGSGINTATLSLDDTIKEIGIDNIEQTFPILTSCSIENDDTLIVTSENFKFKIKGGIIVSATNGIFTYEQIKGSIYNVKQSGEKIGEIEFNNGNDVIGWDEDNNNYAVKDFNKFLNEGLPQAISNYNDLFGANNENAIVNLLYNIYININSEVFKFNDNTQTTITEISTNNLTNIKVAYQDNTSDNSSTILFNPTPINIVCSPTQSIPNSIEVLINGIQSQRVVQCNFTISTCNFGNNYIIYQYDFTNNFLPFVGDNEKWYINNTPTEIVAKGIDGDQPNIVFIKTIIVNGKVNGRIIGHSCAGLPSLKLTDEKTIDFNINLNQSNENNTTKKIVFRLPEINKNVSTDALVKNLLIVNISDVIKIKDNNYEYIDSTNKDVITPIVTFWNFENTEDNGSDWKFIQQENNTPVDMQYLVGFESIKNLIKSTTSNRLNEDIENHEFNKVNFKKHNFEPKNLPNTKAQFRIDYADYLLRMNYLIDGNYSKFINENGRFIYSSFPSLELSSIALKNSFFWNSLNFISEGSNTINRFLRIGKISDTKFGITTEVKPEYFDEERSFIEKTIKLPTRFNTFSIETPETEVQKLKANTFVSTPYILGTEDLETLIKNDYLGQFICNPTIFAVNNSDNIKTIIEELPKRFNGLISIDGKQIDIQEYVKEYLQGLFFGDRIFISNNFDEHINRLQKDFSFIDVLEGIKLTYHDINALSSLQSKNATITNELDVKKRIIVGDTEINTTTIKTQSIETRNAKITDNEVVAPKGSFDEVSVKERLTTKNITVNEKANILAIENGWNYTEVRGNYIYQKSITPLGAVSKTFDIKSPSYSTASTMFYTVEGVSYLNLGAFANTYIRDLVDGRDDSTEWINYSQKIVFANDIWASETSKTQQDENHVIIHIPNVNAPLLKLNVVINGDNQFSDYYVYPQFDVTLKQEGTQWLVRVTEIGNEDDARITDIINSAIKPLYETINKLYKKIESLEGQITTYLNFDGNGGQVIK